jgi:hypothetical protein
MRSFCDGKVLARKGYDLDQHEWAFRAAEEVQKNLEVGKETVKQARDELALTDEQGAIDWDNGAYWNCWQMFAVRERHVTRYKRLILKLPSRELNSAFIAKSGYYLMDASGHCFGLAISVEQTDRTGSWKDSKDWWWYIRPDGRCGDTKSLKVAAAMILRIEEEEIKKRRLQRLDDEALAEIA